MLTDMMKDELVKGLLNLFHENLSMIILYGSVARNEATSESDIDIAIITKNDMNEEIRNKVILSQYLVNRKLNVCKVLLNLKFFSLLIRHFHKRRKYQFLIN